MHALFMLRSCSYDCKRYARTKSSTGTPRRRILEGPQRSCWRRNVGMLLRPFLRRLARVGVAHVRCGERKPILQKRLRDLAQSDPSFQAKASLHLMSSRWFNQVHSELLAHQKLALCPCLRRGELCNFFCRPAAITPHSHGSVPGSFLALQHTISALPNRQSHGQNSGF